MLENKELVVRCSVLEVSWRGQSHKSGSYYLFNILIVDNIGGVCGHTPRAEQRTV
jgi:hypothetical protein